MTLAIATNHICMISVIVPICDVEGYLPRCLESLAAQTFPEIEIILVDDGSIDRSGSIVDSYNNDPRFRVFHTENRGLSAARNYGIEQSRGDWLMFGLNHYFAKFRIILL